MTPCPRCGSTMELDAMQGYQCENPNCEPDPWQLLRKLLDAVTAQNGPVSPRVAMARADARKALKQHDAERKSDGK